MANLLPLNTFKTVTVNLDIDPGSTPWPVVYTAPVGVTTIVLMAQIANLDTVDHYVTAAHTADGGSTITYLVKELGVPVQDAISVLTGKLVLEQGQGLVLFDDAGGPVTQAVLSLLETSVE